MYLRWGSGLEMVLMLSAVMDNRSYVAHKLLSRRIYGRVLARFVAPLSYTSAVPTNIYSFFISVLTGIKVFYAYCNAAGEQQPSRNKDRGRVVEQRRVLMHNLCT